MAKTQNIRPEDRHGVKRGTALANLFIGLYLNFARLWRRLPRFRGKVRSAISLRKLLGLENQHIQEAVRLARPVPYLALLDLHSWHEFVAYFDGGYESDTVEFLGRCFDGKGYFLDLGANIGLISLPFALLTSSRDATNTKVYCVEAVTSNFQRLQENIKINELVNEVTPLNVGVGEEEKTVFIQVEGNLRDGEGTGTANVLAENSNYAAEKISLEITTLDKLLTNGDIPKNCSLIKIDLDGYDLKALEGAHSLLTSSRPIIYGEFSSHCMNWHGQTHQDVVDYMRALEYEVFFRVKGSWHFTKDGRQSDGDLLILPHERKGNFLWCLDKVMH